MIKLPCAGRAVLPFDLVAVVQQRPGPVEARAVRQEHVRPIGSFIVDEGVLAAHVDDMRGSDHDNGQRIPVQYRHCPCPWVCVWNGLDDMNIVKYLDYMELGLNGQGA
jgi:hypothetical protein